MRAFVRANRKLSETLTRMLPSVFAASSSYNDELKMRIQLSVDLMHQPVVLEVGGIDRPLLEKNENYTYVGIDIESKGRCYDVYDQFIVQSIEQPMDGEFDLIISKTLLEHVPDNEASIKNMFASLKPTGKMHHYIPSKWHPYSIALRIVGPSLQRKLISVLRPSAVGVTGYEAFFDRCSPQAMARLCEEAGFVEIEVKPFFRANDYFAFFTPFFVAVSLFENLTRMLNLTTFCSGFILSAKRQDENLLTMNREPVLSREASFQERRGLD